jgi:molybdate transport system permease protein
MDWFPLFNSLRIALISTVITFFLGIFAAYYIAKTPRMVKGVLDVILTLPLVLPPTVIGFFILKVMGPKGAVGSLIYSWFDTKIVMTWYSAILQT